MVTALTRWFVGLTFSCMVFAAWNGFLAVSYACQQTHESARFQSDQEWLKTIAPGVRLIGRAPPFAELGKVVEIFCLSDGKRMLVRCDQGLCLCDIDEQRVLDRQPLSGNDSNFLTASPDRRRFVWSNNFASDEPDEMEASDDVLYRGNKLDRVELVFLDEDLQRTGALTLDRDDYVENVVTPVISVTFSPDNGRYVALLQGRQIVGNAVTGEIIRVLEYDFEWVSGAAFSPDSKGLVLFAKTPVVFDIENGERIRDSVIAKNLPNQPPYFWIYSPDRKSAIVASRGKITLVEAESGESIRAMESSSQVNAFGGKFSSDGKIFCSVASFLSTESPGPHAVFWNVADGKEMGREKLEQMTWLYDCSRDGQSILVPYLVTDGIREIRLAADGAGAQKVEEFLPKAIDVAFNTSGTAVAITGMSKVRMVQIENGTPDTVESGSIFLHANPTDDRYAGIGGMSYLDCYVEELDGKKLTSRVRGKIEAVREIDVVRGALAFAGASPEGFATFYPDIPLDAIYGPDGKQVLGLFHQSKKGIVLRKWSEKESPQSDLLVPMDKVVLTQMNVGGMEGMVRRGRISPDGKWVAYVHGDRVHLVATKTKEELHSLPVQPELRDLVISGDGKLLAVVGAKQIEIWDAATGESLKMLDAISAHVAFSARTSRLLIAPSSGEIAAQVFDTENWQKVREYRSKAGDRVAADLSADGRQVVIGLADGRLEHWNLDGMD